MRARLLVVEPVILCSSLGLYDGKTYKSLGLRCLLFGMLRWLLFSLFYLLSLSSLELRDYLWT